MDRDRGGRDIFLVVTELCTDGICPVSQAESHLLQLVTIGGSCCIVTMEQSRSMAELLQCRDRPVTIYTWRKLNTFISAESNFSNFSFCSRQFHFNLGHDLH